MNDINHVDRNTIRLPDFFPKIACNRYTIYIAFDEMCTVTISSFPTWHEKTHQIEVHVVNLLTISYCYDMCSTNIINLQLSEKSISKKNQKRSHFISTLLGR